MSTLTFLGFCFNSALDTGNYSYIDVLIVKKEIEKGRIFEFLEKELGQDIDLSILSNTDKKTLNEEWLEFCVAIDERRKMGISKNGINLLLAYTLESIQRHPKFSIGK